MIILIIDTIALEPAVNHNVNYVLVDDKYEIDINL